MTSGPRRFRSGYRMREVDDYLEGKFKFEKRPEKESEQPKATWDDMVAIGRIACGSADTVAEAARLARVSVWSYYRGLKEGKLPGRKVRGQWRVSRRQLHRFLDGEDGGSDVA